MPIQNSDALQYTLNALRRHAGNGYGYDLYLPNLIGCFQQEHEHTPYVGPNPRMYELSPAFYAAAWELCRRGILRPGPRTMDAQHTSDGSAGNGYSITPFGRTWLQESDRDDFVPTEPERFGQLLSPFVDLLGPGFYSRAQEAVRCYGAHAYLACCAMSGAAAESILLRIAIEKRGDEGTVLKEYATAGGRTKIENSILGRAKQQTQGEFRAFTMLLKYWRDDAAHGKASSVSDIEAYTSIAMLLRFAMYVRDNWAGLLSV